MTDVKFKNSAEIEKQFMSMGNAAPEPRNRYVIEICDCCGTYLELEAATFPEACAAAMKLMVGCCERKYSPRLWTLRVTDRDNVDIDTHGLTPQQQHLVDSLEEVIRGNWSRYAG